MFQKKLIAAAILASVAAAPAMADVTISDKETMVSTRLATVTKAPVLALTTADQDIHFTIPANELKLDGTVTFVINGAATYNDADVRKFLTENAGVYELGLAAAGGTISFAKADVEAQFDTDTDGVATWLKYVIDEDGKRIRLFSKATNDGTGSSNEQFEVNFSKANQIFNVTKGFSSDITLSIGALLNASYTSDPDTTPAIFSPVDLFQLEQADMVQTGIAQVSTGFKQLDLADNTISTSSLLIRNLSTNQQIQKSKVTIGIEGDFTGAKVSANGELQDKDGNGIGWALANGVATQVLAASGNLEGSGADQTTGGSQDITSFLLAFNGEDAIEASSYKATATILGSDNATYDDFTTSLADVFIVTRDGLKFDTITTGTTSSNTIYIRDVSDALPEAGGKIYVTVIEYGEHGVNGAGDGTVLVERAALSTLLPSFGAVTLDPRQVQEDVGVTVTEGRQARFIFEVETNKGEVAIKKQVSGVGVDIQNGTKGADMVDFTL
ncbi:VapA family S-layer protein [Motilimonas pumila]|uniref:S-layer protein n=1 Tax=Motilimonas pumila TaxID=2303987 RepID=A0A418YDW9_9GAMM|nr:S-layer protein [Motilimonas pumila]RJG42735.1 S-layer protein [Motilimonas pumila]